MSIGFLLEFKEDLFCYGTSVNGIVTKHKTGAGQRLEYFTYLLLYVTSLPTLLSYVFLLRQIIFKHLQLLVSKML